MLILSRKESESIVIDGNIVVRVEAVTGNRVKLSIEAPKEVKVIRDELRRK